jgi:hypothetical protein
MTKQIKVRWILLPLSFLSIVVYLTACPGAAPTTKQPTTTKYDTGGYNPPTPDAKVVTPDAGLKSEAKVTQIDSGTGGPCPCSGNQECVQNVCYVKCTRSGICSATSTCPVNQGCVELKATPGSFICVNGQQAGATCDGANPCGNGYICASTDQGLTFRCLATCPTVDAACGTGGKCIQSNKAGCNFCNAL